LLLCARGIVEKSAQRSIQTSLNTMVAVLLKAVDCVPFQLPRLTLESDSCLRLEMGRKEPARSEYRFL
jgi:hypothetical protein